MTQELGQLMQRLRIGLIPKGLRVFSIIPAIMDILFPCFLSHFYLQPMTEVVGKISSSPSTPH